MLRPEVECYGECHAAGARDEVGDDKDEFKFSDALESLIMGKKWGRKSDSCIRMYVANCPSARMKLLIHHSSGSAASTAPQHTCTLDIHIQ